MRQAPGSVRVGVDIGGTFTDILLLSDSGDLVTRKLSTTPYDYWRAVVCSAGGLLEPTGVTAGTGTCCITSSQEAASTAIHSSGTLSSYWSTSLTKGTARNTRDASTASKCAKAVVQLTSRQLRIRGTGSPRRRRTRARTALELASRVEAER